MKFDTPLGWSYKYTKSNKVVPFPCAEVKDASLLFIRIPVGDGYGYQYKESIDSLISKEDRLNRNGLYMLALRSGGFYIGQVKKRTLKKRIKEHRDDHGEDLASITVVVSTYESGFEDEEINALESLLIQSGRELLPNLTNKRDEGFAVRNPIAQGEYEEKADLILEMFVELNKWAVINASAGRKQSVRRESQPTAVFSEKIAPITVARTRDKASIDEDSYEQEVEKRLEPIGDEAIYSFVIRRDVPTDGYKNRKPRIFKGNLIKKALFMYLYDGKAVDTVERELTKGFRPKKKKQGYPTSSLLNYYQMHSKRVNRGIMEGKLSAKEAELMISEFVDRNTPPEVLGNLWLRDI